MAHCRRCGGEVIWARSVVSKRWLPLDVHTVSAGVRFTVVHKGGVPIAVVENTIRGHESHFVKHPECKKRPQPPACQQELSF